MNVTALSLAHNPLYNGELLFLHFSGLNKHDRTCYQWAVELLVGVFLPSVEPGGFSVSCPYVKLRQPSPILSIQVWEWHPSSHQTLRKKEMVHFLKCQTTTQAASFQMFQSLGDLTAKACSASPAESYEYWAELRPLIWGRTVRYDSTKSLM